MIESVTEFLQSQIADSKHSTYQVNQALKTHERKVYISQFWSNGITKQAIEAEDCIEDAY